MTAPATITLAARAKLNLALSVGPALPAKGYHPIASWFVAIELHDTLSIERITGPSSFHIRWSEDAPKPTPTPIDWPVEKDLAVRAHRLLEREVGHPLSVSMKLHKRTPVGGGLGGGSSDAAAMLVGVNQLFSLNVPPFRLRELSVSLGSDIAFFIDDGPSAGPPNPAIVSGFGDTIERIAPVPATDVLLLIPPFGCPTGPVYQAFDRAPTACADEQRVRGIARDAERAGRIDSGSLFNDLASPACIVQPRLADALRDLRDAAGPGVPVHVTGSGSTMFCIPGPGELDGIEERLRSARPDVVVLASRFAVRGSVPGA